MDGSMGGGGGGTINMNGGAMTAGAASWTAWDEPIMMTCCDGLEFTRRRLLLLASQFLWAYCVWVYVDIFIFVPKRPGFAPVGSRLPLYLVGSGFALLELGIMTVSMTHPGCIPSRSGTDEELEVPSPCCILAQLLLVLFPFFFALRVHEDRPISLWFVLAIGYIDASGVLLIALLDAHKSCYWLIVCVLIALVCTPFTGFYPHHPLLLKLKLVMACLSLAIALLCGVAYLSHRRQDPTPPPPPPRAVTATRVLPTDHHPTTVDHHQDPPPPRAATGSLPTDHQSRTLDSIV